LKEKFHQKKPLEKASAKETKKSLKVPAGAVLFFFCSRKLLFSGV